jgi:hypothetical protein
MSDLLIYVHQQDQYKSLAHGSIVNVNLLFRIVIKEAFSNQKIIIALKLGLSGVTL